MAIGYPRETVQNQKQSWFWIWAFESYQRADWGSVSDLPQLPREMKRCPLSRTFWSEKKTTFRIRVESKGHNLVFDVSPNGMKIKFTIDKRGKSTAMLNNKWTAWTKKRIHRNLLFLPRSGIEPRTTGKRDIAMTTTPSAHGWARVKNQT